MKKRKIWGELVPYNTIWRTGANKASCISTSSDLYIEGDLLEKGKYAIFTIPRENDSWTVIFNSDWDQWGSYNYNQQKDVMRIRVSPKVSEFTENMTFNLSDENINFKWENLSYTLQYEIFQ